MTFEEIIDNVLESEGGYVNDKDDPGGETNMGISKRAYPDLDIKAAISPPFQPIEAYDIEGLAKHVNDLNPTFFWCGLGAPKQERVMALLQPHLNNTISVGVGLAFEYFAGTVKRAPIFMQKNGLEWLYLQLL